MISLPSPGQEKMVSVTTAKASVEPNSSPKTVTMGMAISRSTCRSRMVRSERPAARANFTVSVSITSRVPERARRIMSANLNSARLMAGSNMCWRPSSVRKLHSTPNRLAVAPRPPAGSQPSWTAKAKISTSPTQKVGTEKPMMEAAMSSFAAGLFGR